MASTAMHVGVGAASASSRLASHAGCGGSLCSGSRSLTSTDWPGRMLPASMSDGVSSLTSCRPSCCDEQLGRRLARDGHSAAQLRGIDPRARVLASIVGASRCRFVGLGPMTKPMTEPMTCGHGLAPGSPCYCTPLSPAVCVTTPPPRCDSVRWSCSPWGWLSISRGNPGPVVRSWEVEVEKEGREEEQTATAKTKADDRSVRLGWCAWTRRVTAKAIGTGVTGGRVGAVGQHGGGGR